MFSPRSTDLAIFRFMSMILLFENITFRIFLQYFHFFAFDLTEDSYSTFNRDLGLRKIQC